MDDLVIVGKSIPISNVPVDGKVPEEEEEEDLTYDDGDDGGKGSDDVVAEVADSDVAPSGGSAEPEASKHAEAPAAASGSAYSFAHVPWTATVMSDRDLKEKLTQWNLDESTRIQRFRYNEKLDMDHLDEFLVDFFNSPAVREQFLVQSRSRAWVVLTGRATSVQYKQLATNVLSLDFWDRCQENGLVLESGYIRKKMREDVEGVAIDDELKDLLVNPESEHESLYSEEERAEFMFHCFQTIVTGGPTCQYDDSWTSYLDVTKSLYKDLLTVHKHPTTNKVEVASLVYRVTALDTSQPLFASDSPHNACYVVVDPLRKQITTWYSSFIPFW